MSLSARIASISMFRVVLFSALLASAYYSFTFDDGTKESQEIQKLKLEVASYDKQIADTQKAIADGPKFEREVNQVSDLFKAALEYLPKSMDTQDLLRQISSQAGLTGTRLSAVQPKSPEMKDFYEEVLMEVELTGTYGQLTLFLSNVSKIRRIINIRNIEMTQLSIVDSRPLLSMKGTLVGYRYVEGK